MHAICVVSVNILAFVDFVTGTFLLDKLSQANQRSRPTSRTSGTRGEPSSSQSGGQRVQKSVSSTATRPVGSQCVQAAFDPKLIEFMKGVVAARGSQVTIHEHECFLSNPTDG